jgi:glycosyltransferase involved in cell wall biosynthesis
VNDGSTDGTLNRILPYQDSIRIVNQHNLGQAAAVNRGWESLDTRYFMYLSADDRLCAEGVIDLLECLERDESIAIAYGNFDLIDERGNMLRRIYPKPFDPSRLFSRFACEPGVGVVMRRTVFDSIGGWSTAFRQIGDLEYWMRAAPKFRFRKVETVAGCFRVYGGSRTYRGGGSGASDEYRRLLAQLAAECDYFRSLDQSERRVADSFAWLLAARASAKRLEGVRMVRELAYSIRVTPRLLWDLEALRSLCGSMLEYLARRASTYRAGSA